MPGRFTVLQASKEVSLSCSCVNIVMKQENTVWKVKPWSSKPQSWVNFYFVSMSLSKWQREARERATVVCTVNPRKEGFLSGVVMDQNGRGCHWPKAKRQDAQAQ